MVPVNWDDIVSLDVGSVGFGAATAGEPPNMSANASANPNTPLFNRATSASFPRICLNPIVLRTSKGGGW